MNYKLDCKEWNSVHVKFSVFDRQGANCGTLIVQTSDVFFFVGCAWKGNVFWNDKLPPHAHKHLELYGLPT